jgi:hypothetical protein
LGLLSVWVDRQWSNKLECYAAQGRRVVMAYGSVGVHREELKDKELLSLRTELRNFRLMRSGMIKMIRGTLATLPTLRGAALMSNPKMLETIPIFTLMFKRRARANRHIPHWE